jgi:patatin-like phospholipase/acyl hydrolase
VRDREITVVDAVMASAAAPTFFDPVRVHEYLLADGGIWANNPSLVAYTEAVGKLGQNPDDVRVLSIGTGTGNQPYDVEPRAPKCEACEKVPVWILIVGAIGWMCLTRSNPPMPAGS